MSYQYVEFDGVSLPLFNHNQNHNPMAAESTLLDSLGMAFDYQGSQRKRGRKQNISMQGVYIGETEYLVDDVGDVLVDDLDDSLIAGNSETMLRAQVGALLEKEGVRGSLWRERLEDDVLEWKTARLLQVGWQRTYEDHGIRANVSCQFETKMEFWHAQTATTVSVSASSGAPVGLTIDNAGQIVRDATITITRTSGTISSVSLVYEGQGITITWVGGLGTGHVLTIDCGAQTVRKGSTDAYSGWTITGSQSNAGWLPLIPGPSLLLATVTGGGATVALSFYNQYP